MKKKVFFATGSRADYGIMRRYLALLQNNKEIDLKIVVTGALLDVKFGHQVDLIYEDGFEVVSEIPVAINTDTNANIVRNMASTMEKFACFFSENKCDLLIILGDRYEMLSVSIAAAMQKIPILHIHGGEATYGNYDEFIRHAITKMSLYHFTSTEKYRQRVVQLGENPQKVFCLGALGAENCINIDEKNVPRWITNLNKKGYFVVLFHPETLTNVDTEEQTQEVLDAISHFSQFGYVFIGTNADTHSDVIRSMVKDFVQCTDNTCYYENLHSDAYHYLVKNSIGLIGNSSSGIIEAPSLGVYTINIGDRQKGRVCGNSILDVPCETQHICDAINRICNQKNPIRINNPYYKENSAELYYKKTMEILELIEKDLQNPKVFYDLTLNFQKFSK